MGEESGSRPAFHRAGGRWRSVGGGGLL